MNIIQKLLTPNKYSRPQTRLNKVSKIAVHWVGNAGSSALGNNSYFESLKVGKTYVDSKGKTQYLFASSHYCIGLKGEIIQNIPEYEIAYCTNSANVYSISIECCHPDWTGKFTEETYNSLLELCADLCKRYGLNPINDIIRHYDITKKDCPRWFVNNPNEWTIFKEKVNSELNKDSFEQIVQKFVNKKIIGDASYWLENCQEGKSIDGQYANKIILRFIAMFKIFNTFKEVCDYMKELGVSNSPDYWYTHAIIGESVDGKNMKRLLINMSSKF